MVSFSQTNVHKIFTVTGTNVLRNCARTTLNLTLQNLKMEKNFQIMQNVGNSLSLRRCIPIILAMK